MTRSTDQPNSRIFYRGPSQLDGVGIIGVITGLTTPSSNAKTGDMLQTYILLEKLPPPEAVRTGADRSICGSCALRGDGNGLGRACYVQTKWAPLAVWKFVQPSLRYWRGTRSPLLDDEVAHAIGQGKLDRHLRLGTYGDPAAIPLYVWEWLLAGTAGWTGYTHQWRTCDVKFREILMASVDTPSDYVDAQLAGWRTFRTRRAGEPMMRLANERTLSEIICPASAEAGHLTTCQKCQLCRGTATGRAANITIIAHGSNAAKRDRPVLPFED